MFSATLLSLSSWCSSQTTRELHARTHSFKKILA
jgi:hypothetical protein